jgi:hypothetical protein
MKTCGSGYIDPHFLTLTPVAGVWSALCHCHFTSGERGPGTHWMGGWLDPRAGLDDLEK